MFGERYYQIGKINLKYNLLAQILLAIVFLLLSPFLMGVENLDQIRTAKVLEMYVSLIGVILLVPVFNPEQNKNIRDLVATKYSSMFLVYLIRILEAIIGITVLLAVYLLLLKYFNCTFPFARFYFGTLADAIFLGGIGLIAYSFSDQVTIGYMIPLAYYVINLSAGYKKMRSLYLFSMIYEGYREKFYLSIVGISFLVIGILYRKWFGYHK